MNDSRPQFVPAADYFQELLTRIPKAKKRIIINALVIWWGPRTEQLLPLLLDAASRGVEVRLVGDLYSKFRAYTSHSSRSEPPSWEHTSKVNEQLRAAGAHITYVGSIRLHPYKNRCHSKITIIDDYSYTFGGANFADDLFENRDYMLRAKDASLADRLYRLVRKIERDPKLPLPDLSKSFGPDNTLLFDGGTPGQSIIYETACGIVAQAKKVYFVSQMCPSGRLAKLITARENECYYIHANQTDLPANFALLWDQFRYGVKNRYQGKAYIHAKFLLTENHDGSRHLVSGSNNFSWRGVKYGTKEIALCSTNSELWEDFYNFLQNDIRPAALQ